jgi:hypothetical protein
VSAGEAVRAGLSELGRRRAATAIAVLSSVTAALALAAAWQRASAALGGGVRGGGDPRELARAAGLLLVGGAFASLLVDVGCAAALCAYARSPEQPGAWDWLAEGARRTPALIAISAVELTVYFMLALATLGVGTRVAATGAGPIRAAVMAALGSAPALLIALALFSAARVALVLAAGGLPPAPSLARGFDLVARRLPTLARLAGSLVASSSPLTATGLFLGLAAPRLGVAGWLVGALSYGCFALAALWGYAALAALLGEG